MCVKAVNALLAIIMALCLAKAQNIYEPVQLQQQKHNDDFKQLPKSVTEFEIEVNIEVRQNPNTTNFEVRQPIVGVNLNRVEDDDRIIFPSYAENENRRQEFNELDRVRDNNIPEHVKEINREQELKAYRSEQGNIESKPNHNSGFNRATDRDNNREFVNESERVIELNRKQEREPYRSDQERVASNIQEFMAKPEMTTDRNIGFNRDTDSDNDREFDNGSDHVIEFNREQEREPYRSDEERGSQPREEFNGNTERRPDRNSGFNRDNDREFVSVPDRATEFNREQERDLGKGASNRQEFRAKPDKKLDRNSGLNRETEQVVHRDKVFKQEVDVELKLQRVMPPLKEEESRRLCETKYNEYIARIFRNDEEITADANDSEFDGRVLASPGEYPHMTALGFEREDNTYDYKCGGSLISENFVITAAHCTNVTGEVPTVARIGDINLLVDEQHLAPQIFRIRRIYTHPQYDGVTYYNDIALLQLNTSVEFTEFVRPIKLWTQPKLPLITAFAMGYGATSFARAPTQQLTDFNMTLIANDECNQRLPQLDEVPRGIIASQICAEDFVMHRDTCQGDSGGPLQYNIRGKRRRNRVHYHLIGITSFGLLCRSPNPGVYTRIYSYLDWIERTVWKSL